MSQDRFDSIFRPGLFAERVVLVTGGGSGIGRCIAHELASLGPAGGRATFAVLDIRDGEAVDATVASLVEEQGQGAVVNIVADVWNGAPGMVHTGAARAGVMNMTVTLAAEWAAQGVRVNAVAPGAILTSGLATYPEEIQRRMLTEVEVTPPSRLGTESEVSACVLFLLSPAASYVSGEVMRVDGASSVHKKPVVPLGHHAGTPSWDGFHLRPQLGGLHREAEERKAREAAGGGAREAD